MKTLFTLLIAALFTTLSFAQVETCDCKKDLDFLVMKMKKTPGYKHQIKNIKEAEFLSMYETLSNEMSAKTPIETCFKLLSQQMSTVKDYHAGVEMNKGFFNKEDLDAAERITEFKNSDFFKNLPRVDIDLSELKKILSQKPESSFEGVYNLKEDLVIGIYKNETDNNYVGIVLESNIPTWEVGQIHFYATQNVHGKYDIYNYEMYTYRPRIVSNLTFENGRIWNFKKVGNEKNAELYTGEEGNWIFRDLNESVQYIRISHFSGSSSNRKAQKQFYKAMETKLTAPNLILDLRSNGGGSYEVSDPFLKLFKQKNMTVYVMTNAYTGSNAEQFTTKLLELDTTIHVGQATFGLITYGYDKKLPTAPSGYFTFRVMDMDFHKDYFSYEGIGVVPEIKLEFDKDWIEQTLSIIEENNNLSN